MRLGETESVEAIHALTALSRNTDRDTALRSFVEGANPDPRDEKKMRQLESEYGTDGGLILQLGDHPDLAAGLAGAMMKGTGLGHVLGQLAADTVGQDPQHALSFGNSLDGEARTIFLDQFARGWAAADASAAWAWAAQQPDAALRESMEESVINGLSETDPLAASQHLALLPLGKGRDQALQQVGEGWAMSDTQAALNWADSLPNPQDRDLAAKGIRGVAPVGIGAVLRDNGPDGYPLIMDVVPGGPASAWPQFAQGTQIVSVRDGAGKLIDLQGKDINTTVSLLRGSPNTQVTMEIIPPGGTIADRQSVVLTRKQMVYKR